MDNDRVFGLETEYAAVFDTGKALGVRELFELCQPPYPLVQWDEASEHPWFDARGFVPVASGLSAFQLPLELLQLPPDKLTETKVPARVAQPDTPMEVTVEHAPSTMLANGARFYLDHTHPEFSIPECANPLEAVLYDKAGEVWLSELVGRFNATYNGQAHCRIYKNNLDAHENTYGCHENYSINAITHQSLFGSHSHRLFTALIPFLVSRQIFCGAGKVAPIADGQAFGFHISQRASFFEQVIGLQTTQQRPLINTRDEPHADPMFFRRLHVITGDSNLSEYSTYLKLGTFGLLLDVLESTQLRLDLTLANPIAALQQISEDPTCKVTVELENGQNFSALDMQRYFLDIVGHWLDEHGDQTYRRQAWQVWSETLDALAEDPANLAARIDWLIKYEFLQAQMDKNGWDWSTPQIRELDFKYHLLDSQQGLFPMLLNNDLVDRLLNDEDITMASSQPPHDTRAHLRMACLKRYPEQIKAVNWDTLVFTDQKQAVYRWRMGDPLFNGGADLETCLQQDQLIKVVSNLLEKTPQTRRH